MLRSELMLGEKVPVPALIVSGNLCGCPHPLPTRSTRQRFPPSPGKTLPLKFPSIGFPPSAAGRFEAKTRKEPSGAMDDSRSFHFPEKGATVAGDHCPFTRFETRIIEPLPLPRVKKTVFPV